LRTQIRHATEELPRLEKRFEEIRQDIATRQDTQGEAFVMQLDGQAIRDRGIAGELLIRHAERIRGSRGERQVGRFAGFDVLVAANFMTGADIVLKGTGAHIAKVGTTALGTMRSVEYVIQNLDETAATVEQRIADTRKRIADLQVQGDQPFEYEERLASLSRRLLEIEDALDLTKNQAAAQLEAGGDSPNDEVSAPFGPGEEIPEGEALETVVA
jgi:hypothetical protein